MQIIPLLLAVAISTGGVPISSVDCKMGERAHSASYECCPPSSVGGEAMLNEACCTLEVTPNMSEAVAPSRSIDDYPSLAAIRPQSVLPGIQEIQNLLFAEATSTGPPIPLFLRLRTLRI